MVLPLRRLAPGSPGGPPADSGAGPCLRHWLSSSGTGPDARPLEPICGVDLWEEALHRAAFKARALQVRNVFLARGDGATLPFRDAGFDLIVCNLGINNFAQPALVLAECARVAAPSARLALTTNVVGHMAEFYEVFRKALLDFRMQEFLPRLEANEAHRGTRESVCRLLAESGFRVTDTFQETFRLRYGSAGALFQHWLTRCGFMDGWRGVVEPEVQNVVFAEIQHRLDAIVSERGELSMTIPMLYLEAVLEAQANP